MKGAAKRLCQCRVRPSVQAAKAGECHGGGPDGESRASDGRSRLAQKKILAAGDKPGRIELLKGETGEKRLPFGRKCELPGVSPSTAYSRREPVANPRDEEDMELARKLYEFSEELVREK